MPPVSRRAVALVGILLLAGSAAGLWAAARWARSSPEPGVYRDVAGTVTDFWTKRMVVIAHEPIPGLMDEAMTHPFFVASPELLAGLRRGDRVRFTLRERKDDPAGEPDGLVIVRLEKRP